MGDKPTFLSLLRSPVLLLAFGFGSGLSKKAPGTVGSLVALGIWILIADLALIPYIIFLIISGLIGVYICGVASE
ncbi:phosphatidylglycerophosphatase A, partial [bacterium]|nr:phosphatidylglycerophosphatase A [bacterium]